MEILAKAYATPGGSTTGAEAVELVIIDGLRTTHELAYHAGQWENGDEWFQWEIACSGRIGRICTLLFDRIPAELRTDLLAAIDHFVPDPGWNYPAHDDRHKPSTGANRLDLCCNVAVRGILGDNAERVAIARDTAPVAFGFVETEDGLYSDGSFVQHRVVAYTGSYGTVQLSKTAQLLSLLGNSSWQLTDPRVANMVGSVRHAYAPWIFNGAMMSAVRGRAVARKDASDHGTGYGCLPRILEFARGVEPAVAAEWRGRVRGWIERDGYGKLSQSVDVPGLIAIKELMNSSTRPVAEPVEHVVFPKMDRAVLRRPGWAVGLALSSSRIARFEVMSGGENKRPWHQGSGAVYLYLDGDGDGQFTDGFWPTVDPYRLPGTTVDSQRQNDILGGALATMMGFGKLTGGSMVGGDYDGDHYRGARYASIVHHEGGFRSEMRARQSWFGLDHGVLCLGAGITAGSGSPIETIVENRRVPVGGTDRWHVNGTELDDSAVPGWSATLTGVDHLTLDGTAGYVFLDGPRTIKVRREDRTGHWSDIRQGGDQTPITRGYQTAWLDHGNDPADARYAWLLAPRATVQRTAELARDPGVEVIANDTRVQAAWVPNRGFLGANFFGRGSVTAGPITATADQMCSLSALFSRDRVAEIAIADPTQLADTLTLTMRLPSGRGWSVGGTDHGVTATGRGRILTLVADVSSHNGLVRRALLRHQAADR